MTEKIVWFVGVPTQEGYRSMLTASSFSETRSLQLAKRKSEDLVKHRFR